MLILDFHESSIGMLPVECVDNISHLAMFFRQQLEHHQAMIEVDASSV